MNSRCCFIAAHLGAMQWSAFLLAACLFIFCCRETQVTAATRLDEGSGENQAQIPHQTPRKKTQDTLKLGEPVSWQIKGGESHTFEILLASGQYAQIAIEQQGSILLATLFDPLGNEVIQMDSPAGGYGPIYLSAIASRSGAYQLEVRSTNKWANALSYGVGLKALRTQQAEDLALIEAERAFADGRKHYRADQPEAALKSYDRALSYWKASGNHHWQALSEYARSEAYRGFDRQRSEECLDEVLRILKVEMAPNDWRLKASALNDLGPLYGALGQNEKAIRVYGEALNLFAAHQDQRGQATVLNNLARLHGRAGSLSLAKELIDRALVFRRAENDRPGEINLLNALGAVSDQLGEPDKALTYFTEALHRWEEMDEIRPADLAKIAVVLSNLATASDKLGKWDQALEYYDKALAKYNEGDPRRAATLDSKGELYASLGNTQKAKECYDEALRLLAKGKADVDVKAGVLVHVGQLSLADDDLLAAIKNFEEARSIQPGQPKLAGVLTNLGAALALKGDLEKAMEAYQSALEIQLKLADQRGQALTLQKRGEAYALLQKATEAFADFRQALVLWQNVKDQRGEASTYDDIARVEQERGNIAAALANSDRAIRIVEALRTNISSHNLRTSYFATKENYYEIAIDLKMQLSKSEGRKEYLVAALELSERARSRVLLDALSEVGVGRGEFNRSLDRELIELIEQRTNLQARLGAKAQARTKLLNGQPASKQIAAIDQEITAVTEQDDALDVKLRSRNSRFGSLTKYQPSTLPEIQQQLDDNTILLEYSLGEAKSFAWVVTPDSINGFELPSRGEIEPAARRVTEAVTARNREVKNESIAQRNLRIVKAEKQYVEASTALSQMVLGPVTALLGQKRLVVVADGALQLVPFAALPVPETTNAANSIAEGVQYTARASTTTARSANTAGIGLPLIAPHEIITLPSASVLALQRRELGNRKLAPLEVAVLADPVFDSDDVRVARGSLKQNRNDPGVNKLAVTSPSKQGAPVSSAPHLSRVEQAPQSPLRQPKKESPLATALRDLGLGEDGKLPRLTHSRREANAIAAAVQTRQSFSALDFKASRETATSSELSKYRIIHFAAHGFLDMEHPELSGIVLSMVDEKGQPQDGYLRLHDIYNLNLPAELIVLSACQTGIGKQIKGEGLIALTRGFMYAGAKSVIASLWKVDDEATAALMAEFYKQMFTNKLKPAAALRAAQIKISQEKRWQSPYFWAGFFIQGEWN